MNRARTGSNDARTERSVLAFVSRPLAVLVGVASLSFAAYSALVGASTSSADWTPTPCEILASRVASGPTQELRADGAFRGSGGVPVAELKSFEPLVTYRYSVHGAEHEGHEQVGVGAGRGGHREILWSVADLLSDRVRDAWTLGPHLISING